MLTRPQRPDAMLKDRDRHIPHEGAHLLKFFIFNDRFSSNMGDGVLAGCLEDGLRRLLPHAHIRTVDLGCREHHELESVIAQKSPRALLRHAWFLAPRFLHDALARYRVGHKFRRHIASQTIGADGFIIGGGQLITGSSNFFPLRLAAIASIAQSMNAPLLVHSVGVSNPAAWQAPATDHLRRTFVGNPRLAAASVRDEVSAEYWTRAFGTARPAIARDPGLLAGSVYADEIAQARAARTPTSAKRVGVGVIAANVVNWLASPGTAISPSNEFLMATGIALIRKGHVPIYFTNGSGEDEAALIQLEAHFRRNAPDLAARAVFERRPATPEALVATIAGLDGMIAHRLHANIVAYALMIPHVGLGWDEKLKSFFQSVGRDEFLLDGGTDPAADAVRLLDEAMGRGIAQQDHQRIVGEAWSAIEMLAARLAAIGSTGRIPITFPGQYATTP